MRTLLRLPNWVGDTLLALPALEALSRGPSEELVFAGRELPLDLTRHICLNAPRLLLSRAGGPGLSGRAALRALRALGLERAVLFTPSFSAAFWAWAAGIDLRIGWPEQGRGLLLTERVARGERGAMHLVDEFGRLATHAGAEVRARVPNLPRDPDGEKGAMRFLRDHPASDRGRPAPRVALCPGVQYGSAKRWPITHFARLREILEGRGIGGLVIGSGQERGLAEAVLEGASQLWALGAGEGSLRFSAELLRHAAAAVCNDTGSMHLAAAVGTPVVALFGPTDPRWTRPVGPGHRILRARCDCAPCLRRNCPQGDPAPCMQKISPEVAADAVMATLAQQSGCAQRGEDGAGSRALFLDRDGTICALVPYLHDPRELRLLAGAGEALRAASDAGYLLVVVTNQSGIARGLFSRRNVESVHEALQRALSAHGVRIDGFYICPHHPDHTGPCSCRKPEPGMLQEAAAEMGIDLRRSFMIGDTVEDLIAGERAGCRAVLVATGSGQQQLKERSEALPTGTETAKELANAIYRILRGSIRAGDAR